MTDYEIINGVIIYPETEVNVSIAVNDIVTHVRYVSANGNNTNGLTWATAYTSLKTALDAVSSSASDLTMINIAPGSYDLNTTGMPSYSSNIFLRGGDRSMVTITNTHATATGILKFTGKVVLEGLTFDIGATAQTAINFNGSSCNGHITQCYIECEAATGAHTAILVDGTLEYLRMEDIHVHGVAANTTAIKFSGTTNYCELHNIWIFVAKVGIHLDITGDEYNRFFDIRLNSCVTGLLIDVGADYNRFADIYFEGNTANISDAATGTTYINLHLDKEIVSQTPDDSTGILVTSGGANTYGDAAAVINNIATPFTLRGFVCTAMSDVNSNYTIQLLSGGVVVGTYIFFGGTTRTASVQGSSGWIAPNTAITAKGKSSTAGADTTRFFLKYVATG